MKKIKVEQTNNVLVVTINKPESLNALDPELIISIGDCLKEHENNKNIFGVILTGEGEKAFAAGADIKGFPKLQGEEGADLSNSGHEVFDYIENYPKPVIAAINGYALGGGLELAMACHMRIASDNAVFGMPEVKLGLIPGYGGTQRLSHLIGKAKALEYIISAEMMDAQTALSLGLVNHVTELSELLELSRKIIGKISRNGPMAVASAIKVVNAAFDESRNGFEEEVKEFGKLMVSDEAREGVQAFLEKRKPNFR